MLSKWHTVCLMNYTEGWILVKMSTRPVANDGRVSSGLAGEGDSLALQDGARLDGQGHHRRVYTGRDTYSKIIWMKVVFQLCQTTLGLISHTNYKFHNKIWYSKTSPLYSQHSTGSTSTVTAVIVPVITNYTGLGKHINLLDWKFKLQFPCEQSFLISSGTRLKSLKKYPVFQMLKKTCFSSKDAAKSTQTATSNLEPAQVWEWWKTVAVNSYTQLMFGFSVIIKSSWQVLGQIIKIIEWFCHVPTQTQPHYAASHSDRDKGQHTVDVEGNSGSFAHRHGRVAGHAGEVAAAVSVDRCDGQVAPGRHPLPVR